MLDLGLMVEGQNGLTWARWAALIETAERCGFAAVFRNDHFLNPAGSHLPALELWSSLTWAAQHSRGIELGPLVSPFSFRHPVVAAWTGAAIDDLSGGRLRLGFGLGWNEREHRAYGFDLPALPERYARFAEGLEVVHRLLHAEEPVSFAGAHYRLEEALLLPRPARPGGPPLTVGGNGDRRTLPLAARFADEWNAVAVGPERFRALNARLDDLLQAEGRDPATVLRSVMTQAIVAPTRAAAEARWPDVVELRARGGFAGTPAEFVAHLRAFAEAGVQRAVLRWLEIDDLEMLELIGREVIPALA